jgi:hypothetical protein
MSRTERKKQKLLSRVRRTRDQKEKRIKKQEAIDHNNVWAAYVRGAIS